MGRYPFHDSLIGPELFEAFVTEAGLLLSHRCTQFANEQCAFLGHGLLLRHVKVKRHAAWQIGRELDDNHITLRCLTRSQLFQLSKEFGIPAAAATVADEPLFFASRAYNALRSWALIHPRLAKQYGRATTSMPSRYHRIYRPPDLISAV